MWMRLTMPPWPDFTNAIRPEQNEPPMPIAIVVCTAESSMILLAATAEPNTPVTPGA